MASAKLSVEIGNLVVDLLTAYRSVHGDDAFIQDVQRALAEDCSIVSIRQVGQEKSRLHFEAIPSPFLLGLMAAHGVTL